MTYTQIYDIYNTYNKLSINQMLMSQNVNYTRRSLERTMVYERKLILKLSVA